MALPVSWCKKSKYKITKSVNQNKSFVQKKSFAFVWRKIIKLWRDFVKSVKQITWYHSSKCLWSVLTKDSKYSPLQVSRFDKNYATNAEEKEERLGEGFNILRTKWQVYWSACANTHGTWQLIIQRLTTSVLNFFYVKDQRTKKRWKKSWKNLWRNRVSLFPRFPEKNSPLVFSL